jgi:hypothetical protein
VSSCTSVLYGPRTAIEPQVHNVQQARFVIDYCVLRIVIIVETGASFAPGNMAELTSPVSEVFGPEDGCGIRGVRGYVSVACYRLLRVPERGNVESR